MDADGARAGVAVPPGAKEPALQLVGLVKRFGERTAADHLDVAVPRGSFFGLVGPNGAGKTTTLSMAVGPLRPDHGNARIFGIDVWADPVAAKQLVGVLPRRPGPARAADRP
jgi:ABC-type multidrug transport system ATPase subunit